MNFRLTSKDFFVGICGAAITAIIVGVQNGGRLGAIVTAALLQFVGQLVVLQALTRRQVRPAQEKVETQSNSRFVLEPCVIWFTGLPSSGKTTLSLRLKNYLESIAVNIEHLDGDTVRAILSGIGFSRAERNDHIRRMGFLASRLEYQGITVIASFVSPYRESRDFVRQICKNFIEVHLSTDLAECSRRDVKGLYGETKAGKRSGMTGVDDPYEAPLSPELILDTATLSEESCLQAIINLLSSRGLFRQNDFSRNGAIGRNYGSPIASRAQ